MAKNMRNYILFDLETSGLDPKACEIVEIGAIAVRYDNYEIHEAGKFQILIKPQKPQNADQGAIDTIGQELWNKALTEGIHPKVAYKKFVEFVNKANPQPGKFWSSPIMTGFNSVSFDMPFLTEQMEQYKIINQKKDDKPWAYIQYDMAPKLHAIFGRDDLKNNKLDTYLELMGLSRSTEFHGAMEDTELTYQIFKRYMKFMQRIRPMISFKQQEPVTV